jgi:hypothetical protein
MFIGTSNPSILTPDFISHANVTETTYITNAYTGIQYKWDGIQWTKSFEGVYTNEKWRLML